MPVSTHAISSTLPGQSADAVFTVASNAPSTNERFVGQIDNLRIYSYVRSDADIAAAAAR